MKPIITTCYVNPDLDGFACAIAYAEFLNKTDRPSYPGLFGNLQEEIQFILKKFNFEFSNHKPEQDSPIVLVDASELNALGKSIKPESVIEIIDHRKANDVQSFPNAKVQIEFVGSASSLIAEKFKEKNIEPSQMSAILLSAAIISNTLNFKSSTKTEKDEQMFAWLTPFANLPNDFAHEMFAAKSDLSGNKLRQHLEDEYAWRTEKNGERSGVGQLEIIGSEKLVAKKKEEIFQILDDIAKKNDINYSFLSIIDLETDHNIFLSKDKKIMDILEHVLDIKFENNIARRPGLIMRKEIMPLFRKELEKNENN